MKIVPKLDDIRLFGILAFLNGLEYHNFDFSRLIGNHFCTAYENLERFRVVTPEF